jgi:hypothetical protein
MLRVACQQLAAHNEKALHAFKKLRAILLRSLKTLVLDSGSFHSLDRKLDRFLTMAEHTRLDNPSSVKHVLRALASTLLLKQLTINIVVEDISYDDDGEESIKLYQLRSPSSPS